MSASSSFIAKNRAGILGVSRLAQTIFLMACLADPWRTADGLRFGTSPVSRQTNEALRPSDGNPEVIGWSVGLVLTNALVVPELSKVIDWPEGHLRRNDWGANEGGAVFELSPQ
jgi:hypothetical protein